MQAALQQRMFAWGWAVTAPGALADTVAVRPPKGKDTRARPGAVQGSLKQGIHRSPQELFGVQSLVGSSAKSASLFRGGLSARRYASGSESRMRLANSNPIGVASPPSKSPSISPCWTQTSVAPPRRNTAPVLPPAL